MEIVTGISFKQIFIDNGNWWKFFIKYPKEAFREAIIVNVVKMLICKTPLLGFHRYLCSKCHFSKKVSHTCKSKFCSSCGKKATDQWTQTALQTLPKTTWQHITFTMPKIYWDLFWLNRDLMNCFPIIAAHIILEPAAKQGAKVGIFLAIHTFGRQLTRNYHLHLSTTCEGLALDDKKRIKKLYFDEGTVKRRWRARVTKLFRDEYKAGRLKLPKSLQHIKNYTQFNRLLNKEYQKTWHVELGDQSNNHKNTIEYIGRYLKRPPIGETKIKEYDGKTVKFEFLDHNTGYTETLPLPVFTFIARLITHIHDQYFRVIRYYGFLSNRTRGKLLPRVYLFPQSREKKSPTNYI